MVRPERLRLTQTAPSDGSGVPVTVEHAVFQGPVVRCTLRAADRTEIVAHVGPEQSLPTLQPGLGLWVGWDTGAARLLPPADGATLAPTSLDDMAAPLHTIERAIPRHP
jgi:spermidine/putrescine transport system ATP-binding protein